MKNLRRLAGSELARMRARAREIYVRQVRDFASRFYRASLAHGARASVMRVPIPELNVSGGQGAGEGKTAEKKWELIANTLPSGTATALDVGSYTGFYALRLARAGVFTIAVEANKDLLRLAQLAVNESGTEMVATALMAVRPDNVDRLPPADVTLVLSVMHYWVEQSGWAVAETMLRTIWDRTAKVLYFETPNPCENSKMAPHLREMGSTVAECESFVRDMFGRMNGAHVELLAYLPTDFRGNERRHLFKVSRA